MDSTMGGILTGGVSKHGYPWMPPTHPPYQPIPTRRHSLGPCGTQHQEAETEEREETRSERMPTIWPPAMPKSMAKKPPPILMWPRLPCGVAWPEGGTESRESWGGETGGVEGASNWRGGMTLNPKRREDGNQGIGTRNKEAPARGGRDMRGLMTQEERGQVELEEKINRDVHNAMWERWELERIDLERNRPGGWGDGEGDTFPSSTALSWGSRIWTAESAEDPQEQEDRVAESERMTSTGEWDTWEQMEDEPGLPTGAWDQNGTGGRTWRDQTKESVTHEWFSDSEDMKRVYGGGRRGNYPVGEGSSGFRGDDEWNSGSSMSRVPEQPKRPYMRTPDKGYKEGTNQVRKVMAAKSAPPMKKRWVRERKR